MCTQAGGASHFKRWKRATGGSACVSRKSISAGEQEAREWLRMFEGGSSQWGAGRAKAKQVKVGTPAEVQQRRARTLTGCGLEAGCRQGRRGDANGDPYVHG